ncbi:MAG TPA: 4'-phosphopantetheinyl transferase superfamily protein [Streptomyces sp.]|uniref:4'-phosphopantetheinyl transferase family protein n=1 Tax=Streptomyces sp. TaxID=1931 RepID=UPI002D15F8FF|nr:4'-phosphopantetheinyl transferase superfamily protein [Streptomyces sp.]HWU05818.1 4'-phosphopantetheinyl transferase superfamily protein [Streptomyces sp.]
MSKDATDNSPQGPLVVAASPEEVLRTMDPHLLTASERRRGAVLRHPADRHSHAAAHLLVRYCAAALTGRPVGTLALVQRCADCGSTDHGKPSLTGLPDLHVSLAHTRGAVVAGVDGYPVGVDVEDSRVHEIDPAVMTYTLTAAEVGRVQSARDPSTAFLRLWVRKECLVKIGVVTLDGLSRIEIDPGTERDVGAGRTVGRFGSLHVADWFDEALQVVIAAAGSEPPIVGSFPVGPASAAGPGETPLPT